MFLSKPSHLRVIDFAGIEVLPPDTMPALAQMPRDHARSVLLETFRWHDTATEYPMHVIAQTDRLRLGVVKIVVKFTRLIGHLWRMIVHGQPNGSLFEARA